MEEAAGLASPPFRDGLGRLESRLPLRRPRGPRRVRPSGSCTTAPLPPWPGRSLDEVASRLDSECEWLVAHNVLPVDVVTRNRRLAETALRPWTPAFTHGDLQITHVFVDGDTVTGIIDWFEASQGDALYDLAALTLAHEEHLDEVAAGDGTYVDRNLIRAWWSCIAVRWLVERASAHSRICPR